VEFVPRGILRSFLTKEFNISASFLPPFDAKFSFGRDGSAQDVDAKAIFSNKPSLLSSSLVCLNSLQNALGVVDMVLRTEVGNEANFEILGEAAAGATTSSVLLGSNRRPLPLRSQELFTKSVRIQQIHHSEVVSAPASPLGNALYRKLAAEKEKPSARPPPASERILCPGHLEVRWRILQTHILRCPLTTASAVAPDSPVKKAIAYSRMEAVRSAPNSPRPSSDHTPLDWLLSLGRDPRDLTGSRTPGGSNASPAVDVAHDLKYLDREVRSSSLCRVMFPIPEVKVNNSCSSFCSLFQIEKSDDF
jgi:hypothetical protein